MLFQRNIFVNNTSWPTFHSSSINVSGSPPLRIISLFDPIYLINTQHCDWIIPKWIYASSYCIWVCLCMMKSVPWNLSAHVPTLCSLESEPLLAWLIGTICRNQYPMDMWYKKVLWVFVIKGVQKKRLQMKIHYWKCNLEV